MRRSALIYLAAVLAVAACSGPASSTPPTTQSTTVSLPSAAAGSTTAPAVDGNVVACKSAPGTAETVRDIAATAQKGPVLPAAVALFLLDARQKAAAPGITDPALVAAEAAMLSAIDDLDAQGRAALPPGGNPAQNAVKIDPTRALAAVAAVEKACAALGH